MKNNYTDTIYKDLMNLVEKNEAFFHKDFNLEGETYRIFNYRLASWTLFLEPNALNARGITFKVTNESNPELVSLPPAKFFNYEEGNVDHSKGKLVDKMVKMDGSLISTYNHNGTCLLKTKGSLFSEQAYAAMKWLDKEENVGLKAELQKLNDNGYTANLEYTSPENRIVIAYQKEDLTLLMVRENATGNSFYASKLERFLKENGYTNLLSKLVSYEIIKDSPADQLKFVDEVRAEQEGEGYVIQVVVNENDSYLVKVKNTKYLTLHQTKDSVNSSKRLFEAIIEEGSDDLRSMFSDDEYILKKIEKMEKHVQGIFNHMVAKVEGFYETNKALERKDFAILAQKDIKEFMPLVMSLYLNREPEYKEFAKKRRVELFGIEDKVESLEEKEIDFGQSKKMKP